MSFLLKNFNYLVLWIVFFPCFAVAQSTTIYSIDQLPDNGLLLNKNWKYQVGDNLSWSQPTFDDSDWKKIDPTRELSELPEVFDDNIKWLRLNFEITSKLPQPLGIAINQAGASEIYLNGKLVHKYGHFDTDVSKVIAYDPKELAIHLPADTLGQYTLAVRYVLQPNIRYTNTFAVAFNSLFKATLVDLVPSLHRKRTFHLFYSGSDIFVMGVIFLLFVLHLAMYFYQKENKTQLFLACYLFTASVLRIFKILGQNEYFLAERYWYLQTANLLLGVTVIFLTVVLYRMAHMRLDIFFHIQVVYQIIYVSISAINYGSPIQTLLLLIGSLYSFFILIRAVWYGRKKGIKGFLVVGSAIFISIFSLVWISTFVLFFGQKVSHDGFSELTIGISPYFVAIVFSAGSLAVPIGLSIFMGIQGGEVNKKLKKQLAENDRLKNKTIEHEKEKQQILATQNETLEKQVAERTAELHNSLESLKNTQNQLVQSEKLASLGELTAGIAHEIQNPLNFVNNFAELSVDLAKDISSEIQQPDIDKPYIEELLTDLSHNQDKIQHHGMRASNIVKGMLAHSRASTGVSELADINKIADEYLRLSYHGIRARDKSFNADFKTDFDENLPLVKIIPQDIGRVLLNLYNNAFFAVNEKKQNQPDKDYQPLVSVSTQLVENRVVIKVKDNGTGMPESVREKVFQPFFTTKPAGLGTGLGLSISYDIVTKGHGGTFEINTKEGSFTEFIITIP